MPKRKQTMWMHRAYIGGTGLLGLIHLETFEEMSIFTERWDINKFGYKYCKLNLETYIYATTKLPHTPFSKKTVTFTKFNVNEVLTIIILPHMIICFACGYVPKLARGVHAKLLDE
ncbi:hypothetical protein ACJX0J_011388, partial [Zea mays]